MTQIYHSCGRCAHLIRPPRPLLDEEHWDLAPIESGSNGHVYRAMCRSTGCVHAAKFLNAHCERELRMIELYARMPHNHVAQIICTGQSKHRVACRTESQRGVSVVLQELLDEDLWQVIYSPSVRVPVFGQWQMLKHLAWHVLAGLSSKSTIVAISRWEG